MKLKLRKKVLQWFLKKACWVGSYSFSCLVIMENNFIGCKNKAGYWQSVNIFNFFLPLPDVAFRGFSNWSFKEMINYKQTYYMADFQISLVIFVCRKKMLNNIEMAWRIKIKSSFFNTLHRSYWNLYNLKNFMYSDKLKGITYEEGCNLCLRRRI